MPGLPSEPGSASDMRFAATLVVEGVLPEPTVRAMISKQRELLERGRSLTIAEIACRKAWMTSSEAAYLAALEEPPKDLLPGFALRRLIGLGGMSRVFGAIEQASGAPRALKILHPRLARSEEAKKRFIAESTLTSALSHGNLIAGYGLIEHDGLLAMALEWFESQSALALLDEKGRFEESLALSVIVQVASALEPLHARGIIHRDVKPANVLIDATGRAKLCDLGLAVERELLRNDGLTVGTAAYLAPEQAIGATELDARTDIYALGATLYHMVVGALPFEGETDAETMAQRLWDELHSKALKALGISPPLHFVIQKMMALDPKIRYPSAQALVEDVKALVDGQARLKPPTVPPKRGPGALKTPGPSSSPRRMGPRSSRP